MTNNISNQTKQDILNKLATNKGLQELSLESVVQFLDSRGWSQRGISELASYGDSGVFTGNLVNPSAVPLSEQVATQA